MYDYTYYGDYGSSASSLLDGFAVLGRFLFVGTIVSILMIVSMWKIFKKAGKQGWEAIVPIYNIIVLFEITSLPTWYIVLYLIPFANIYAIIKSYIELAKKFGKDTGFGVLTLFFPVICLPILAFSKCSYNNENESSVINNTNVSNNVNTMNQVNNTNVNNMNTVNTIPNTEPVNNVTNNTNNDVYSFNSMSDIQSLNQNTNNINQNVEPTINSTQVNNNINEVPSVTPVMPENNTNNDINNNQNNINNMFQ